MRKVLVTGVAGFIGYHVAERLLEDGVDVVGLDNLNDYYDPALKNARLDRLRCSPGFVFHRVDVSDADAVQDLVRASEPSHIIHLAAQAGVRHSLTHPFDYISSNVTGTLSILEASRYCGVEHVVYASSSSVYGGRSDTPFRVSAPVDNPHSIYAASKKACELMAHTYSQLFRVPTTGLRFFTVYGPWGRPDMSMYLFAKAILAGAPIDIFNHGRMRRDFTYVSDIVEGVTRVMKLPPSADRSDSSTGAPYKIYNIGCSAPVELLTMIELLERAIGRTAIRRLLPMQLGDVVETCADVSDLERDVGFRPRVSIEEGVERFVAWYLGYYGRS
jgi:UDP-glucuronate 4-epimerase